MALKYCVLLACFLAVYEVSCHKVYNLDEVEKVYQIKVFAHQSIYLVPYVKEIARRTQKLAKKTEEKLNKSVQEGKNHDECKETATKEINKIKLAINNEIEKIQKEYKKSNEEFGKGWQNVKDSLNNKHDGCIYDAEKMKTEECKKKWKHIHLHSLYDESKRAARKDIKRIGKETHANIKKISKDCKTASKEWIEKAKEEIKKCNMKA